MLPYVLLPMSRRTGVVDGAPFPTHRRTRWKVTLRVSSLAAGGSVSVKIQASPDAQNEDAFEDLHDFGAVAAAGATVVRSFAADDGTAADFTVAERHLHLRAKLYAATGEHVAEVLAEGRFLDLGVVAHLDLLPSSLRQSKASRDRFADQAEQDVVRHLAVGSRGSLSLKAQDPEVDDVVRQAIVAQADWLQRREILRSSGKEEDRREGRRMRRLSPDVDGILADVREWSAAAWWGR